MPYISRVEPMACLWQKWAWDVAIFMTVQSEGKPSLPETNTQKYEHKPSLLKTSIQQIMTKCNKFKTKLFSAL